MNLGRIHLLDQDRTTFERLGPTRLIFMTEGQSFNHSLIILTRYL
jgi:hypothetical protein